MGSSAGARTWGRVHVVDLVALALAVGLAALAYAYLFRRTPVPRPVDPLLGAEVVVEFDGDRAWKESWPAVGGPGSLEEYLGAEVVAVERGLADSPRRARVRLRVLGRETQRPEAMTLFRTGVRRGSVLRMSDLESEIRVEVIEVVPATEKT